MVRIRRKLEFNTVNEVTALITAVPGFHSVHSIIINLRSQFLSSKWSIKSRGSDSCWVTFYAKQYNNVEWFYSHKRYTYIYICMYMVHRCNVNCMSCADGNEGAQQVLTFEVDSFRVSAHDTAVEARGSGGNY